MLDIKQIRSNPDLVKKDLEKRGDLEKVKWVDELLKKEEEYRKLNHKLQGLRSKKNTLSSDINTLKKQGKDISKKIKEMKDLPKEIKKADETVGELKQKVNFYLMRLPNILHESVPVGEDEEDNAEIRKWGALPKFNFKPKSHVDLMLDLDLADMERAAMVAGARFYYLKNELALMDLALQQFAVNFLTKKGFTIMEVPIMINKKAISGAVSLSDFEEVLYKVEDEDLYMIATSEHSLACYHMDEALETSPLKYAGISPCFRKEAGSHGKDTKGIFRVHQFNKVEQFIFCKPEESWKLHEELIANVEELYRLLEIPYRVVNVCTGDMGGIAAKKYDLEVWMPVQDKYREAASCSNCTDYQARKLNTRYGKETAHTLNSTAIATTRTMVAIMENFQNKDGSISIPNALQPYMNGLKKIKKK